MSDFGIIDDILSDPDIGYDIVIEREVVVESDDPVTGDIVSWEVIATVTSSIQNISGDDIIRADKLGIDASHWMFCSVNDIKEADRIVSGGIYYQIQYVDNVIGTGKHQQIFLKQSGNYSVESR